MSKGNNEGNAQQVGVLQRTASLVLAAAVHRFFAGLVKFGEGANEIIPSPMTLRRRA